MGKKDRSIKRDKPPISSHPLFPAIIALWFGALFGLGSLAIRAALLEKLVLATQLDTVIESAAPPLGMTTRILLAVAMAIFGAILGGMVARIIARPKTNQRVRVRKAQQATAAPIKKPEGFGQNYTRASQPLFNDEPLAPAEKGRRRPLTVAEHNDSEFEDISYLSHAAPLPGGAPEIFDVKAHAIPPMMDSSSEMTKAVDVNDPLELTARVSNIPAFASTLAAPEPQDPSNPSIQRDEYPATVFGNSERSDGTPTSTERNNDYRSNDESSEESDFSQPFDLAGFNAESLVPESAHFAVRDAREEFRAVPAEDQQPASSAAPVPAAYEPGEVNPPFQNGTYQEDANPIDMAFATEPSVEEPLNEGPDPLLSFATDDAAKDELPQFAPSSFAQPGNRDSASTLPAKHEPLVAEADQVLASEQAQLAAESEPVEARILAIAPITQSLAGDEQAQPELQQATQFAAPDDVKLQDEFTLTSAKTNLADLSSLELIERLALSIRTRKSEQTVPASVTMPLAQQPVALVEAAHPVAPPPAPSPDGQQTSSAAIALEPSATASGLGRLSIPAALRPINFAEYEDEDELDSYVPQRSITLPQRAVQKPELAVTNPDHADDVAAVAETAEPAARVAHVEELAVTSAPVAVETDEDEDDAYSSLLNVGKQSPAKQNFFRIEEPEDFDTEIEPVVIFPGQGSQAGMRFAAPSASLSVSAGANTAAAPLDLGELQKRFDTQPAVSEIGGTAQIKSGNAFAPPGVDPAETERALRSALATLQRMTGAA